MACAFIRHFPLGSFRVFFLSFYSSARYLACVFYTQQVSSTSTRFSSRKRLVHFPRLRRRPHSRANSRYASGRNGSADSAAQLWREERRRPRGATTAEAAPWQEHCSGSGTRKRKVGRLRRFCFTGGDNLVGCRPRGASEAGQCLHAPRPSSGAGRGSQSSGSARPRRIRGDKAAPTLRTMLVFGPSRRRQRRESDG